MVDFRPLRCPPRNFSLDHKIPHSGESVNPFFPFFAFTVKFDSELTLLLLRLNLNKAHHYCNCISFALGVPFALGGLGFYIISPTLARRNTLRVSRFP